MKHPRGFDLDLAFSLIDYMAGRRCEFTVDDLAGQFGVCRRTAYRYLTVLESRQMIEPVREPCRGTEMCRWRSLVELVLVRRPAAAEDAA